MKHESTNEPIRPLLKAIDESIAKARARRLGVDATDAASTASIFKTDGTANTAQPTPSVNPDGTPMLKAKRKATTSFNAPMPTRNIWDRKAG
jgi:hypothetical protein